MMKKPKASADDFANLLGSASIPPPETPKMKPPAKQKPKSLIPTVVKTEGTPPKKGRGRPAKKGNNAQTTLYYPPHLRKVLKEQALHEDCSVNDLIIEGIELMFAKRGIDPHKRK